LPFVTNLLPRYLLATLLALSAAPLLAQDLPAARLAPTLRARPQATVRVQVRDAAAFRRWASAVLPGAQLKLERADIFEVSHLTKPQFSQLAASPLVEFIDLPNRPAHDERLLNGADLTVNSLRAVQRRYPSLTGRGLVVSIKENALDAADIDFRGRLLNTPAGTPIESVHASIMATLIAGGGNSGPGGEGAARQAGIASASYASLLPDANASLTGLGVSVQNHSYGTGIENYYGLEALGYDQQTRQLPTLLHVFSSGNQGTGTSTSGPYQGLAGVANLTGQFKMSKNSVSVGATNALGQVAALSSRGPAHDGRVKPELVAYGDAGSSDAAALVSGAALLVQQAYRDRTNGSNGLPPAALVRAALINSADDVGRAEVDFVSGFGQLDALGAVRTILDGRYQTGALAQGQEQLISLTIPAGTQQVKITLAWTDPEATANASPALVNDLDLTLLGPGGIARWLPWTLSTYPSLDSLTRAARRRPDHLNNVEQITLTQPAAGTYQLRVRGYRVASGNQDFSVAYEVNATGFEWLNPSQLRNVRPGQATHLRWIWPGAATAGQLAYRPVGRAGWRTIAAAADLSQHTYSWTAPDTTTLAQLRCVVGGQEYVSDTVVIARPPSLRIGYVCADESLLTWPATPGATQYRVYKLGATALEAFQATSDTLLRVLTTQNAGQYFAVAPVLGGRLAERSATANLAEAGVGCYVSSFLPVPAITDTVRLRLTLGTLYRLHAVQLQRLGPNGFETIQTISPVSSRSILFTDLNARPGANQYRIAGQDADGRTFYSTTETVQLVRQGELLVYPVPVPAGQDLLVAGAPGVAFELALYDALGRLVRISEGAAAVNYFSTEGLRPGVYVLRATPATGGTAFTRRAVVE
jgi:hypothetical protein